MAQGFLVQCLVNAESRGGHRVERAPGSSVRGPRRDASDAITGNAVCLHLRPPPCFSPCGPFVSHPFSLAHSSTASIGFYSEAHGRGCFAPADI